MCGIYGELALRPGRPPGAHAEAATDRLAHRGPDDRGSWASDDVFLGATRLSIIDPAGGHQPMASTDGRCRIVYNGELYNFGELRSELEAHGPPFRTRTDTEVVLRAYEAWGVDCLPRFNGMFAFAVWDEPARTLLLARDRLGEKPLYYHRDDGRLAFASEVKAILTDPAVARRISPPGLANYLAFGHASAPQTMFEGVEKLLPGHRLVAHAGRIDIAPYWDLDPEEQCERSDDELAAEIRELLEDSVARRMVADVPVGAFLSGGLDSSAVVALMARGAGRVVTFSAGFATPGVHDERGDARRVAARLGTEHHEVRVETADVIPALEDLAYHYDEPFADPAAVPLLVLSRFARERVKVVLTGDGGDELFGGYRRYVADGLAPLYQRLPAAVVREWIPGAVDRLPRLRRLKRSVRTLPIADPARRYAGWLRVLGPEQLTELLEPDIARLVAPCDPLAAHAKHHGRMHGANRLMYVDVKTWLPDTYLEKSDKATMACGLEARMPLLDHRLVERAFGVPASRKIRALSTKRILRRAVADLLPGEVLRKRKHGFAVPVDRWLRGELGAFARETLLDARARNRGYFRPHAVRALFDEHASGRHVHSAALWTLLNFELWHRTYLDGDGAR